MRRAKADANQVPKGGWNLGEITYAVLSLEQPDRDLDRVVDLFLRAGFRPGSIVEASFAGWASKEPPCYTADVRRVRSMAKHYGVEVRSRRVPKGYEAVASLDGRPTDEVGAFNQATAELAAFLLAVRHGKAP